MVGNPLSSNIKKELLKLLNSKIFDEVDECDALFK